MAYDNSGILSANKWKTKDGQPDYKGSGMYGGKEFWISGWIKERTDEEGMTHKFLSLSLEPKGEEVTIAPKSTSEEMPF